ncbi:Tudor domain-containing protein 1, partial [Stegodyphus mimosarum]
MPGMPCCAKYSYDNAWYRCEITDLTSEGAVVLYVDYGNSEIVPIENLRVLEDYFINFPVQVHFCELYGVKPVGDDWDPSVKEFLISKLISNQEIFARVVVPGKISKVDLCTKNEDGEFKLAYEELIENNLIILDKTAH